MEPLVLISGCMDVTSQGLKDHIYIAANSTIYVARGGGNKRHPARDHPRTGGPLVD